MAILNLQLNFGSQNIRKLYKNTASKIKIHALVLGQNLKKTAMISLSPQLL